MSISSSFSLTIFSHDYYMIYLPSHDYEFMKEASIELFEDFLQYKRLKDYKNRKIKVAPVIRLYGSCENGQKACVHIHGVVIIIIFIFKFHFSTFHIFMSRLIKFFHI